MRGGEPSNPYPTLNHENPVICEVGVGGGCGKRRYHIVVTPGYSRWVETGQGEEIQYRSVVTGYGVSEGVIHSVRSHNSYTRSCLLISGTIALFQWVASRLKVPEGEGSIFTGQKLKCQRSQGPKSFRSWVKNVMGHNVRKIPKRRMEASSVSSS